MTACEKLDVTRRSPTTQLKVGIPRRVALPVEEPSTVKKGRDSDELEACPVKNNCKRVHPIELIAKVTLVSSFL